ncbi:hypothetical protein IT575_12100 [bacterium]|nr:hypothetical protein [bacterium]
MSKKRRDVPMNSAYIEPGKYLVESIDLPPKNNKRQGAMRLGVSIQSDGIQLEPFQLSLTPKQARRLARRLCWLGDFCQREPEYG